MASTKFPSTGQEYLSNLKYNKSVSEIGFSNCEISDDIAEKIAKGGKYYDQIFESNLPYNFYIYALQYHISQFTGINVIILSEIFIYLLFSKVLVLVFVYSGGSLTNWSELPKKNLNF